MSDFLHTLTLPLLEAANVCTLISPVPFVYSLSSLSQESTGLAFHGPRHSACVCAAGLRGVQQKNHTHPEAGCRHTLCEFVISASKQTEPLQQFIRFKESHLYFAESDQTNAEKLYQRTHTGQSRLNLTSSGIRLLTCLSLRKTKNCCIFLKESSGLTLI